MKVFPFSRLIFLLVGIVSYPNPSALVIGWSCFAKIIVMSAFISEIVIQLRSLWFKQPILTSCLGSLGYHTLNIVVFIRMMQKANNLSLMDKMLRQIDDFSQRKVRKTERNRFIITFLLILIVLAMLLTYFLTYGIRSEAVALFLGHLMADNEQPDQHLVLISFTIFVFAITGNSFLIQIYCSVLVATIEMAKQAREICSNSNNYACMKQAFKNYNKVMQTVNETIGIIPFHLLANIFLGFANGISFLVNSTSDVHISPLFALLTIGMLDIVNTFSALQIVELGRESKEVIDEAREIAQDKVTGVSKDPSASLSDERSALKSLLLLEPAVAARACDIIQLDRSLILSFFAQLIPFTVMMFTTLREIENRTSTTRSM